MFSVVVVAFRRAENLETIVEGIPSWVDKIYLFIDGDDTKSQSNQECKDKSRVLALGNPKISVKVYEKNLGPGLSVPTAIEWASKTCDGTLVLEDDCIPTEQAYKFFKKEYERQPNTGIICGSSPFDFQGKTSTMKTLTTSDFALVSGWLITKSAWQKLGIFDLKSFSYLQLLRAAAKDFSKFLPLSFFYASVIKVRKNNVQAWDSALCYSMLINNIRATIPNVTLINNLGADEFATNTHPMKLSHSNVYQIASNHQVASTLDDSLSANKICNQAFMANVYSMKLRHIFSPLKSWIVTRKQTRI